MMNENDYQLGIRDLSKHDLVTLVTEYRKGFEPADSGDSRCAGRGRGRF